MLSWPSSIMQRRSMPIPMPPAGGMPCSSATRKSSSSFCRSPPAMRRHIEPIPASDLAHEVLVFHTTPGRGEVDDFFGLAEMEFCMLLCDCLDHICKRLVGLERCFHDFFTDDLDFVFDHERPQNLLRHLTNHTLHELHHSLVITISLVGFEHGKLGF